ncbi:MAG TPA: type IV secretion system protein [Microbacteriaceae bacterium]|jgi:hypothetical protein|nr:type IV secretion system protein [Microbacteriaceae bacterium]
MWRRSLVVLLVAVASFGAAATPAQAASTASAASIPSLNPCSIPLVGDVCNIPGNVASDAGDAIMKGVTTWVTNFAVWVTSKVGELINATSSPDVQAAWFASEYSTMLAIAGALALPMLLLAVIQAVLRQDIGILLRSAFGYLPMAFILAAGAILATQLLIQVTDDLSSTVLHGMGTSDNLLARVGEAYKRAVDGNQNNAVPLFGAFLGALVLAVGSLVLWLELIIRDATIYIALFFLPLTFVAMIWPATSRYARRLVEFLVAVIFAKLVIVSIVALATAALTHSAVMGEGTTAAAATAASSSDHVFERMVAGAALLVLAAYSPFALLRVIPLLEGAASSVGQSRSTMGGAAASAGVQTPAGYMRQAMSREPSCYAPPGTGSSVSTDGGSGGRGAPGGDGGSGNAAGSWRVSEADATTGASTSGTATSQPSATTPTAGPATAPPAQASPAPTTATQAPTATSPGRQASAPAPERIASPRPRQEAPAQEPAPPTHPTEDER